MSLYRWILIAIILSISARSPAQACLDKLPESHRAIVEQDHWTILQPQDLAPDDLPIWKVNHPGFCPGVATGNFRYGSDTSYVIALIQKNGPSLVEKVLILTPKKKGPEIDVIVPPTQLPTPSVVWSLPPRHYRGVDGASVSLSRPSFAFEKLVGTARQFYYDGSHLKSFLLSY